MSTNLTATIETWTDRGGRAFARLVVGSRVITLRDGASPEEAAASILRSLRAPVPVVAVESEKGAAS